MIYLIGVTYWYILKWTVTFLPANSWQTLDLIITNYITSEVELSNYFQSCNSEPL
jgi:hypothetical protein